MNVFLWIVSLIRTAAFLAMAFPASGLTIARIKYTSHNWQEIGNPTSIAARRQWGHVVLGVALTRIKVENAELLSADEPVVLMTNHSSQLDIPAALALHPGELRIIAKAELGRKPFIGAYLKQGHFLLSRETSLRAAIRADREMLLAAAEYAAKHRVSILVFPEGTRSTDGKLQEFKHGAFLAAIKAGLPIQPVAFLGAHEILPKGAIRLREFRTIRAVVCAKVQTAGRHWHDVAADVRKALIDAGVPDGLATT